MTMSHRLGWGLHHAEFGRVRGNKIRVGEVQGGELYPSDSRLAVRFSVSECPARLRCSKPPKRAESKLHGANAPATPAQQKRTGARVKKYSAMFSFERATVQGDHRHPDKEEHRLALCRAPEEGSHWYAQTARR
jgi:hypothetical protein